MPTTHGMSKTKEYKTWLRIKAKCYDENHISYQKYGGEGIEFEYRDSFIDFLSEIGNCPVQDSSWSIERIDPRLGYVKGNMMWLETDKQAYNRKKFKTNTSGITGVYANGNGWVAEWWHSGERYRRYFPTFEEAVQHRHKMLEELRLNGAYIPPHHGK